MAKEIPVVVDDGTILTLVADRYRYLVVSL
jgi:hypothetical protein